MKRFSHYIIQVFITWCLYYAKLVKKYMHGILRKMKHFHLIYNIQVFSNMVHLLYLKLIMKYMHGDDNHQVFIMYIGAGHLRLHFCMFCKMN